jgi:hypothetical protein
MASLFSPTILMATGEQRSGLGQWYLGANCKKCGTTMLFAPSRGPGQKIPDDGHVEAKCSMCGHEAHYTGCDLQHFWTKG